MILGDRRQRLDNQHEKEGEGSVGSILEGTFPRFLEIREQKYVQTCKIVLIQPYKKDRSGIPSWASCLDYHKGPQNHDSLCHSCIADRHNFLSFKVLTYWFVLLMIPTVQKHRKTAHIKLFL